MFGCDLSRFLVTNDQSQFYNSYFPDFFQSFFTCDFMYIHLKVLHHSPETLDYRCVPLVLAKYLVLYQQCQASIILNVPQTIISMHHEIFLLLASLHKFSLQW